MRKLLNIVFIFIGTIGVNATPSISFSGGGTNGAPLIIDFLEDITIQVKPFSAVSASALGFSVTTDDLFSSVFQGPSQGSLLTSQGAILQTTNGATPQYLTDVAFSGLLGNPSVLTFFNGNEYLLTNGGSVTFTKGTLEIVNTNNPLLGYYVLKQQNAVVDISQSNIYGNGENPPGFNSANVEIVPEPSTYALFVFGLLGLVVVCRRRVA